MGSRHAERARALVGTRFRAQGREAETGLDCAGLVIVAFELVSERFRRDYPLRGEHRAALQSALSSDFRRVSGAESRPGDVMLLSVRADQMHLAIRTSAGFVHADAKRGKVVEAPGEPQWPIVATYRHRSRSPKAA